MQSNSQKEKRKSRRAEKKVFKELIAKIFQNDKNYKSSLVAQWLRIPLPMQGTWIWAQVQALVQEDPTCHGATKPMHHNY